MRSGFGLAFALGLSAACLTGCSDGESTEDPVEFGNHHLWQVGNCEVGTLTPFDPATGEAQACGGNARQVSECVGNKVFTLTIRGMDVTFSQTVNGVTASSNARLERSLYCAKEPSLESDTCSRMAGELAANERLFVMRSLDLALEEQLHPDALWEIRDQAWPGMAACQAALER
jgi:hypothetical protein